MLKAKIAKINKNLLNIVSTLDDNKFIDLIVYCNNSTKARQDFEKNKDVVFCCSLDFIGAVGVRVRARVLENIARLDNVKHITHSASVFAQIKKSKQAIKVENFHNENIFGKGVNIAVIDTGCSSHFDLSFPENKVIYFKDFINKKTNQYDDNGHGTFVCGLIGGNGALSACQNFGVAPKSNLIVLKALDENGETTAMQILEAMQWVYNNKEKFNIKVVCMSFGSIPLGEGDPLVGGAEELWKKGIVVVVAAGNSGPDEKTIKSPGTSARVITVGALDEVEDEKNFKIANFSSRGPTSYGNKPDVIAPGVNIVGLSNGSDFYKTMSGTSMSAPIVAGVCALMLEKWPDYSPNQVKMELMRSGNKIVYNRNIEGAGLIDCKKINHKFL